MPLTGLALEIVKIISLGFEFKRSPKTIDMKVEE